MRYQLRTEAVAPGLAIAPFPFDRVAIGMAYSGYAERFLVDCPDGVDYLEIPFEHLRFDPSVIQLGTKKPIVLHCASLSVAGSVLPSDGLLDEVRTWIDRTKTPWLGEHLSFVTADASFSGQADEYAPGEPFNIGYTVSPAYSEETLQRVLASVAQSSARLNIPFLLENAPIYFQVPSSTMSQAAFFCEVCSNSNIGVLLDLSHLYITSKTLGHDPFSLLSEMPLDRVVEIHVSGADEQDGASWDDHSSPAPKVIHTLLDKALCCAPKLRAVTLEYNWSSRFPRETLLSELSWVRSAVGDARAAGN